MVGKQTQLRKELSHSLWNH